jgi:Protein of unknown function (DUF1207)
MRSKGRLVVCGIIPLQPMRGRWSATLWTFALGVFVLASPASDSWAAASDDAFVAGYATAVLEREFNVRAPSLRVTEGRITLTAEDLAGADREKVVQSLSRIQGVLHVVVGDAETGAKDTGADIARQSPAGDPGPGTGGSPAGPLRVGWLPEGHLFSPLLADPRWPHFSASYQYYPNDKTVRSVGAVSFGETIPIYRMAAPGPGRVEFGLQAGVFAIFDLEAASRDLVNADYFVAALAAYRTGNISVLGRLFHQSSHLGDEFLLRTQVARVNLSYEGLDLLVSYDFPLGFRVYGGGRGLVASDPSDLKPWATQAGVEFRSPLTFWGKRIRPVAAVDVQNHQENGWRTDVSARAGIQFESLQVLGRNLQVLVQYFNGYSPDGQFYNQKIEYIGLGVHLHF